MSDLPNRSAWTTVAFLVLLVVSSCGDTSQSTSPPTTGSTPTTATIGPTTSTAPTATVPSSTVAGDDTQVRAAFVAFFNGADRNVDKKVSLLQDGERYRQMLVDADADSRFQQLRAQVKSVRFADNAECARLGVPYPCAVVTFDLLLGAFPALAGHDGVAAQIAGVWKVAATVWCDVVAIGGDTCPS
jgi:hypothetical protein